MEKDKEILSYRVANVSETYTNVNQSGLNMKPRLMYCRYCKYQITVALAGVQCVKCNSNLITFIAHNELVRSDS